MELTLFLTDYCNLKCSYCYEGKNKEKSFLNKETLKETLDFIVKINLEDEFIFLQFLGGEPLLNKSMLIQTINLIEKEYKTYRHLFRYSITTNGVLLDKNTIDFLAENEFQISISADGDRETFDLNRKSINGKEVYDIILNNIEYMILENIDFSVRMTVTPNNVMSLMKNVLFFIQIGIANFHIGINHFANWTFDELKELDLQLDLLDKYYLQKMQKDEKLTIDIYDNMIATFLLKKEARYCCAGTRGHVIVNSQGELFPCTCVCNDKKWKIGDVKSGLDEKQFFTIVRKNVEKVSHCHACELAFICTGARCGFINYALTGKLNVANEVMCNLERILYKHEKTVIKKLYQLRNFKFMRLYQMVLKDQIELASHVKEMIKNADKEMIEVLHESIE